MTSQVSVLVCDASTMGSTREIAERIADELRAGGVRVECCPAARAPGPENFAAVVLGSAVYFRRWRRDAVRYLRIHRTVLQVRPVWLFQSGPLERDTPTPVPRVVRRLAADLGCPLPITFGGRMDRQHARGLLARWISSSAELRGDNRDWDAVRDWALGIRTELTRLPPRRAATERGR